MALLLSPEAYKQLEDKLGARLAEELVAAFEASLRAIEKKGEETLAKIEARAYSQLSSEALLQKE